MSDKANLSPYLYHYTSINALAQILETKAFLFTPLTNLDDQDEGKIRGLGAWAKYCFVSSWTDEDKESIPMWKMYSSDMCGIRIRLPRDLFPKYLIDLGCMRKFLQKKSQCLIPEGKDDEIYMASPVPAKEYFNSKYNFAGSKSGVDLFKVKYIDQVEQHDLPDEHIGNGMFHVNLDLYGHEKSEHWDFQHEWRYLVKIKPKPYGRVTNMDVSGTVENLQYIYDPDLPFKRYLIHVDKEKFKDMEITLGPKANKGDETLVSLLIKKYNPKAIWNQSILKERIK